MSDPITAYWLDWDYDQDRANTGTRSRYGNYLASRAGSFAEIDDDDPTVAFARLAWRIATGPILAPPLVRSHPRVASTSLLRSDWNGEMIADVTLVSPRPHALAHFKTAGGGYYGDQRFDAWSGHYEGVSEEELERGPYLLTNVRLLWQLPPGTLPSIKEIPAGGDALYRQAVECVEVLVAALNAEVEPAIARLERA